MMNPKRLEGDYYSRLITCFEGAEFRKFETFACREVVSIFNEGKNPTISPNDKEALDVIALNTLLLMLSMFRTNYDTNLTLLSDLNNGTRDEVKQLFISVM